MVKALIGKKLADKNIDEWTVTRQICQYFCLQNFMLYNRSINLTVAKDA